MAPRSLSNNRLWGLPLILGVGLLAGCNSENATDNKTTLVTDTQSCSRGAMALFVSCGDQNAITDELPPSNDTPPAADTSVIITGSGNGGDTQNTEVALDNIATQPIQDVVSIPDYDEVIGRTIMVWTDYSATLLAAHKDNYIESLYQSMPTLAMLATGAGTGPTTDTPYLIVKEDGQVIDPNTLQAIVGSTYGTRDGMEHLHKLLQRWDQTLLGLNPSLDWQRNTSLWGHESYLFLDSYLATLTQYYRPEMTPLDFTANADGSRQIISAWLSNASQGTLTPLMTFSGDQINERTRVVTLNSETVNAAWPELFDASLTTDERFKMLDGTMKLVPTMHTTGTFDVAVSDQYIAFQLPIKNSTLALLVIMPKEGQFATVQTQLSTSPLLTQITAALQPTATTLHLPHFSITTTAEEKIPSASDEAFADFSAVNGQGHLYLKQMARMAMIDVTESGLVTRAAGMSILDATQDEPLSVWNPSYSSGFSAVWVSQDTGSAGQTFGFITPCYYPPLLQPFMFVIRDTTTSTPLYAGVWTTPDGPEMAPDWTTNAFGQGACETLPTNTSPVGWDNVWGTPSDTTSAPANPFP